MKTRLFSLIASAVALLLAVGPPILAQQTAEEFYQAGLYQEDVQGNLERAIDLFEQILAEYPGERSVAANALMHIGLCHEKLGSREAQRAYERLVRDYADQSSVADRARVRLASLQGLARVEAPVEAASSGGIVVRHLFGGSYGEDLEASGPSPDGRYLAGIEWGTTASNIGVWDLVTGESRQLTDHPSYEQGMALSAGFSPDGNTIAYWWLNADEETAEVRLAFRDGSPPRTLCADPGHFYVPGPWRTDGRSLVVSRKDPEGVVEGGWVSLQDGVFRAFDTVPELEPWRGGESLSPDDRYLAFDFGVADHSDRRDISMIPTDGGSEVSIVHHPSNDRVIGWVPGTDDFLFVSDRGGKSDLYAVEVADGEVRGDSRIVQRDVGEMAPMGFTREGDLFYWIYTLRMYISVAPFDPETGAVDAEAGQPLLGSKANPSWSPDGRYLTYWHKKDHPTGASDFDQVLGITDLATGEERELAAHLEVDAPRWSLDGQSILAVALEMDRRESDSPGFFSIDPLTGESSELLRFPPQPNWYWEIGAAQAPNGRDIVYVREGRLVLHEVASGEETEVYRHPGLTSGLLEPSPDGRTLLFAVQDSTWSGLQLGTVSGLQDGMGRLMVARLPGGEVEELLAVDLDQGTKIRNAHWGPEGRYAYFTETAGDEGTILKRVPIGGGEAEVVWVSREPVAEFTISPTGDRVAFTIGENKGDTYVMENLRAALREMRDNR